MEERWIKKKNYRQKYKRKAEREEVPLRKKVKTTPWHQFLKTFIESDDGANAMSSGPSEFTKAASTVYGAMPQVQKAAFKSSEHLETLDVRREGKKIFLRIQKQMTELENLGYSAFAFGYFEDDIQFSSTPSAMCCATPPMIEYLHSIIVAANPPCIPSVGKSKPLNPLAEKPPASAGKTRKTPTPVAVPSVGKPSATSSMKSSPAEKSSVAPAGKFSVVSAEKTRKTPAPSAAVPSVGKLSVASAGKTRKTPAPSVAVPLVAAPSSTKSPPAEKSSVAQAGKLSVVSAGMSPPVKKLPMPKVPSVVKLPNKQFPPTADETLLVPLWDEPPVPAPPSLLRALLEEEKTEEEKTDDNDDSIWIRPTLLMEDKRILESSAWLNDRIISAAQKILQLQAGSTIKGWQPTIYEQNPSKYRRIENEEDFIQILHINRNHWITVSTIGCDVGVVYVYDSEYNSISVKTKKLILQIWKPSVNFAKFMMVNMPRQKNASDCGVYAIATATELAHGRDPLLSHCVWEDVKMRAHLITCLQNQKFSCFPQAMPIASLRHRTVKKKPFKNEPVKDTLFCICRELNNDKKAMIRCDQCKKWYHMECMNVEPDAAHHDQWHCDCTDH